jgi:hypothetical protein
MRWNLLADELAGDWRTGRVASSPSGRPARSGDGAARGIAPASRPPRRLSDLEAIQKRALAEGLPYQTLIASLLHKYAAGRLKEI